MLIEQRAYREISGAFDDQHEGTFQGPRVHSDQAGDIDTAAPDASNSRFDVLQSLVVMRRSQA